MQTQAGLDLGRDIHSPGGIEMKVAAKPSSVLPWLMLVSRIVLFLLMQSAIALGFALAGSRAGWDDGVTWWPLGVTLANVVTILLLIALFRRDGQSYWSIFRLDRTHVKSDLVVLVAAYVVAGPVAMLPNTFLATWLFGDPQAVLQWFVRPLPLWAVYVFALVLFPITQGLAELATYFRYVMPRLESRGLPIWLAVAIPALVLGLQHLAAPFVFDLRFIAWRGLMFIPFGLLTGILLRWRPRLFPYYALVHALMNASFATMFLTVAY